MLAQGSHETSAASAETPLRPPTPFPSEKTQVAPYPWLRRHMGLVATMAPVLSAGATWAIGMLGGMSPVDAFKQLGAPAAAVVVLVMFIVWTYTVFIPRESEKAEKQRQSQLADAADDRALFRDTMLQQADVLREHAEVLKDVSASVKDVASRLGSVEKVLGRIDRQGPASCRHQPLCVVDNDVTPAEPSKAATAARTEAKR